MLNIREALYSFAALFDTAWLYGSRSVRRPMAAKHSNPGGQPGHGNHHTAPAVRGTKGPMVEATKSSSDLHHSIYYWVSVRPGAALSWILTSKVKGSKVEQRQRFGQSPSLPETLRDVLRSGNCAS